MIYYCGYLTRPSSFLLTHSLTYCLLTRCLQEEVGELSLQPEACSLQRARSSTLSLPHYVGLQ